MSINVNEIIIREMLKSGVKPNTFDGREFEMYKWLSYNTTADEIKKKLMLERYFDNNYIMQYGEYKYIWNYISSISCIDIYNIAIKKLNDDEINKAYEKASEIINSLKIKEELFNYINKIRPRGKSMDSTYMNLSMIDSFVYNIICSYVECNKYYNEEIIETMNEMIGRKRQLGKSDSSWNNNICK